MSIQELYLLNIRQTYIIIQEKLMIILLKKNEMDKVMRR